MRSDIARRFPLWLALGAMGLFVAACGVTTASGASNGAVSDGKSAASVTTQTITHLTPSATASATAPAGKVPAGAVTLSLDKANYSPGDTAVVTITNGLSATISTSDHKTSCSLLQLEQLVGGAWQAVEPCRSMIATRMVDLSAGSVTEQRIGIPQGQPGTYRVSFVYSVGGGGSVGASGTVYSPTFTLA